MENPVLDFFLWSSIINLGLLLVSFTAFTLGRNFIYRMHSKWYDITKEQFSAIVYAGLMFYKICIIFFNIVPYIVLRVLLNNI
jgi:hypothetical protein